MNREYWEPRKLDFRIKKLPIEVVRVENESRKEEILEFVLVFCVLIGKKEQKLTLHRSVSLNASSALSSSHLRSRGDENEKKVHVCTNEWKTVVYLMPVLPQ